MREPAVLTHVPLVDAPELSAGARAHARYLSLHPKMALSWPEAHEEFADTEGFTPEGARAGANAVIAPGSKSWRQAIDAWLGTFFHRLPLLHPGLLAVGSGLHEGYAVLDAGSLVEDKVMIQTVAWPYAGMKDVSPRFVPELPNPIPGVDQSTLGTCVTLQVFHDSGNRKLVMSLHEGASPSGPVVDCHFISPYEPLGAEIAPEGAFALLPKSHLKPRQAYTVVVKDLRMQDLEGVKTIEKTWSFRTGK